MFLSNSYLFWQMLRDSRWRPQELTWWKVDSFSREYPLSCLGCSSSTSVLWELSLKWHQHTGKKCELCLYTKFSTIMHSLRPGKVIVRGKSRNFQSNQLFKVRGEGCEFCKAGELVLGDLYKKRIRKITWTVVSNMRIRWRATRDHLREKRKVLNVAERFWLTLARFFFSYCPKRFTR